MQHLYFFTNLINFLLSQPLVQLQMVKIIIDLPTGSICTSDADIKPYTKQSVGLAPDNQFCLTLAILWVPYGYLLYQYIKSMVFLHANNLLTELDNLDLMLILTSFTRLVIMFIFPLINHKHAFITFDICLLLWQFILLLIYLKFVFEGKNWRISLGASSAFYILLFAIYNISNPHSEPNTTSIYVPIYYPMVIFNLILSLVTLSQFYSIRSALTQRLLTPNITIQLKNRKAFLFLTLATCWVTLLMKKYPESFKQILGIVLYFIICEWMNMAIVYRCVIERIIRSHEQQQESESEEIKRRGSEVIVIQMQMSEYRGRK